MQRISVLHGKRNQSMTGFVYTWRSKRPARSNAASKTSGVFVAKKVKLTDEYEIAERRRIRDRYSRGTDRSSHRCRSAKPSIRGR